MRKTLFIILMFSLLACQQERRETSVIFSHDNEDSLLILMDPVAEAQKTPRKIKKQSLRSSGLVHSYRKRTPRPFIRNASAGIISQYDRSFRRHADHLGWDWKLLAAQAYTESAFDPQAVSSAGAIGLMQIMPTTADHLGVKRANLTNPEISIQASVKYSKELMQHYADIQDPQERIRFSLAAYNGGPLHVDGARSKARQQGHDDQQWKNVSQFCYRETRNYVTFIMQRWDKYRGI